MKFLLLLLCAVAAQGSSLFPRGFGQRGQRRIQVAREEVPSYESSGRFFFFFEGWGAGVASFSRF